MSQHRARASHPPTGGRRSPQGSEGGRRLVALAAATTTDPANPDGATGIFTQPALSKYLKAQDNNITVAVDNLKTGTVSEWRPGERMEYDASISKVDILETLLDQLQAEHQPISAEEQYQAEIMIEQSDDDAATDLYDDLGQQSGMDAYNHRLGMADTVAGIDGHWGGTTTTAADQIKLLQALIDPSSPLTSANRSYILGLMHNVISSERWGVSSGVAEDASIDLKNGWLPLIGDYDWQINSIGWINGDGRDYLIAVLSKENDSEGAGIQSVEGISSLVWSALAPVG